MAMKVRRSIPYLPTRLNSFLVSKTLGGSAARLSQGKSSPAIQETSSSVYHVVRGKGHSVIGEKTINWKMGDTFCVPAWYKYQHFADEIETVYLYRFDDRPMLKSLGFYRVADTNMESSVSE
jgi:gentisate 1,2-dioxygenase